LAFGAAALGLGGASYAYLQTEDGRRQSEKFFEWVDGLLGVAQSPSKKLNEIKNSVRVETKGVSTANNSSKASSKAQPPSTDKPLVTETPKEE
jgi:hypothetical protein